MNQSAVTTYPVTEGVGQALEITLRGVDELLLSENGDALDHMLVKSKQEMRRLAALKSKSKLAMQEGFGSKGKERLLSKEGKCSSLILG